METSKKLILGVYDNPDKTYDVTKKLISSGYSVYDVYSPFAIHGLDRVMGIKRSNLTVAAFLFAMTGLSLAVIFQVYVSYFDWQVNVGGKPSLHIPTYIPITFELSILFTAFGMVTCFFIANRMFWGKNADIMDIRVTDDLFVIAVDVKKSKADMGSLNQLLIDGGAIEVREREKQL
ncbi:MAG: quinol:cytochrome C oxidoreductase [Bacteroidetes bacterium B1(2017)]|nr:MAG: quinol:cytochrome C oxidoreductase [Bacteroidetes bacterium B1(2017)]